MKPQYISALFFFDTVSEAKQRFSKLDSSTGKIVLEQHQDGSGSIVYLQDTPTRPGQAPYVGVETPKK